MSTLPTLSVCNQVPIRTSQILIVASIEPNASRWPSAEKATEFIQPSWPSSVCRQAPVPASQILMVLSSEPDASRWPSAEKTTQYTGPSWPLVGFGSLVPSVPPLSRPLRPLSCLTLRSMIHESIPAFCSVSSVSGSPSSKSWTSESPSVGNQLLTTRCFWSRILVWVLVLVIETQYNPMHNYSSAQLNSVNENKQASILCLPLGSSSSSQNAP